MKAVAAPLTCLKDADFCSARPWMHPNQAAANHKGRRLGHIILKSRS